MQAHSISPPALLLIFGGRQLWVASSYVLRLLSASMSAHKRKGKGAQAKGSTTAREPGAATGRGAGSYVLEWVNCGSPVRSQVTAG